MLFSVHIQLIEEPGDGRASPQHDLLSSESALGISAHRDVLLFVAGHTKQGVGGTEAIPFTCRKTQLRRLVSSRPDIQTVGFLQNCLPCRPLSLCELRSKTANKTIRLGGNWGNGSKICN